VPDFADFFRDLGRFFSILEIRTFTTNHSQTPLNSPCHRVTVPETRFVRPDGSLDLNTLVPGAKQLASKNSCL